MKTTILLSAMMFMVFRMSAQTFCTPDSVDFPKDSLISPGSLTAVAGVNYNQTVQFKFPTDTSITFGVPTKIHINTVTLDSVRNFPTSFNYQCGNKACSYKGGQYGCATITGNPTSAQIGEDTVKLYFTVNFTVESGFLAGTTTNDTASGKVLLTIDSSEHSNIFDPTIRNLFEVGQNYPNPFNEITSIAYNVPTVQAANLVVRNELGQRVYEKQLNAIQGSNTFDFERNGLPEGMYFYSIQTGNYIITRRMVIKN